MTPLKQITIEAEVNGHLLHLVDCLYTDKREEAEELLRKFRSDFTAALSEVVDPTEQYLPSSSKFSYTVYFNGLRIGLDLAHRDRSYAARLITRKIAEMAEPAARTLTLREGESMVRAPKVPDSYQVWIGLTSSGRSPKASDVINIKAGRAMENH